MEINRVVVAMNNDNIDNKLSNNKFWILHALRQKFANTVCKGVIKGEHIFFSLFIKIAIKIIIKNSTAKSLYYKNIRFTLEILALKCQCCEHIGFTFGKFEMKWQIFCEYWCNMGKNVNTPVLGQ